MAEIRIEARNEFLNKEGLQRYDEKIKQYIDQKTPQGDWEQTDSTKADYIKNKPSLSTVATSGSYNDLTDVPVFSCEVDEEGVLYIKSSSLTTTATLIGV